MSIDKAYERIDDAIDILRAALTDIEGAEDPESIKDLLQKVYDAKGDDEKTRRILSDAIDEHLGRIY